MTDDDVRDFVKFFGTKNLPNIDQEPKRFEFYLKMWRFLNGK